MEPEYDPDAEPQPDDKEAPTSPNGAPPPTKKQRKGDEVPTDVPEGSVAAAIAAKIGNDRLAAMDTDLARQGHRDENGVHQKFLWDLETEMGCTALVAVNGKEEKLTTIHSVAVFKGSHYALVGEETPKTDPFLIELTKAWIKDWKKVKIPSSEEATKELWSHIKDNPTTGWTGMDAYDDDKDLKQVALPRLLIAPEPLVRYMATRTSTTPGEAATFMLKWQSQQSDLPPTLKENIDHCVETLSAMACRTTAMTTAKSEPASQLAITIKAAMGDDPLAAFKKLVIKNKLQSDRRPPTPVPTAPIAGGGTGALSEERLAQIMAAVSATQATQIAAALQPTQQTGSTSTPKVTGMTQEIKAKIMGWMQTPAETDIPSVWYDIMQASSSAEALEKYQDAVDDYINTYGGEITIACRSISLAYMDELREGKLTPTESLNAGNMNQGHTLAQMFPKSQWDAQEEREFYRQTKASTVTRTLMDAAKIENKRRKTRSPALDMTKLLEVLQDWAIHLAVLYGHGCEHYKMVVEIVRCIKEKKNDSDKYGLGFLTTEKVLAIQWRVMMDAHSFFGTKIKASQLQLNSPPYPQSLLRRTVDNLYEDHVITPHTMPTAWKAITFNRTPVRGAGTGGVIPPAGGPPSGPPTGTPPDFGRRTPRGDGRRRNTGQFATNEWHDMVNDQIKQAVEWYRAKCEANGIIGQLSHFLPKLPADGGGGRGREGNRGPKKDWSGVPTHRNNDAMVCARWSFGICPTGAECKHMHLAPDQLPTEFTTKLLAVVTNGKTRAEDTLNRMIRARNEDQMGGRFRGRQ